MAEENRSVQEQRQGMLKRAIGTQFHRVASWLAERCPNGKNQHLFMHKLIGRVRFYLFLRIGFDVNREKKLSEKGIGLEPAGIIFLDGNAKKQDKR